MLKKVIDSLTGASGRVSEPAPVKYPGLRDAVDGNTAIIHVEREASDAAGAYPITPSTQMGEYWAEEAAAGHMNISDRPLIFVEPESEHAAAAVTAGLYFLRYKDEPTSPAKSGARPAPFLVFAPLVRSGSGGELLLSGRF